MIDWIFIACMWAAVAIVSVYLLRRRSAESSARLSLARGGGKENRLTGREAERERERVALRPPRFRVRSVAAASPEALLVARIEEAVGPTWKVVGRSPLSCFAEVCPEIAGRPRLEAASLLEDRFVDAALLDPGSGAVRLALFFDAPVGMRRRGEERFAEDSCHAVCDDAGIASLRLNPRRDLEPALLRVRLRAVLGEEGEAAGGLTAVRDR